MPKPTSTRWGAYFVIFRDWRPRFDPELVGRAFFGFNELFGFFQRGFTDCGVGLVGDEGMFLCHALSYFLFITAMPRNTKAPPNH